MKAFILLSTFLFIGLVSRGQQTVLQGLVTSQNSPTENITVKILSLNKATKSNQSGAYHFNDIPSGSYDVLFSGVGHQNKKIKITVNNDTTFLNVDLISMEANLKDVVITGVNRATELRKSPVPIAVLAKKAMDQNVNTNLIEAIVKGVPGVTAVTTGPNVSKPFIRGLGYNRVLTLYDGLRQEGQQWGDEHGIEVDEYGIARAEVVKGPASLTYGSDALAGVINMIPYSPNFANGKLKGDFTTNYQTNNGMIGSSLGLAFIKNDWKFTVRGTGKTAHNYENKIDGLVYGTAFREYNFSASARVDKHWGFSKTAVTYYDNLMEIPDGSRDSLSRKFTRQILDDGDDIKKRPIVPDNELNTYGINPLHQHIQHYRFYNTSQFKFGNSDLNILLGGQQSVRREYNHPTVPQQAGLYVVLNTFNYDLKYNLPDFSGLKVQLV
ncbi:TonB-dependent receptor plug domain-containing protein [Pedobacter sp. HDW13]|uniref:TonB-dependent receptor n=1 Tax=Pedobacter sp. HDW13 TaxID=2714940 RepID=UPI0019815539|nr:TonB-dependent receptor plug domain-containing protein [Pedobacter sp. HDW13]